MENDMRGWAGQMRRDSLKDQIMTGCFIALYGGGVVAMIIIMALK